MAWINPLDLQTILVNTLAGSTDIFVALAIISFAGLAAYFRMQNEMALILIGLFTIFMSEWIGNGYMIAVILIASLLTYFAIAKLVK